MKARRLGSLVAALLFAAPAYAGLFDDEEARARVERLRTELRAELEDIAKRVDLAAKNQIDFANQAEALKADLAKLRGQVEVVVYELDAAQKRQKDFYVDLDTRLRKIEAATVEAAKAKTDAADEAAKPQTPKHDPAAEMRDYENALTAFKGAKYKDAHAAFTAFIKQYPGSVMLASAHYWAASSLYQSRDYARAAEMFGAVAANWPDDGKTPDALLAQANAQFEAGDAKGGRRTLETLVEKYPASSAAHTAKPRLKAPATSAKKK